MWKWEREVGAGNGGGAKRRDATRLLRAITTLTGAPMTHVRGHTLMQTEPAHDASLPPSTIPSHSLDRTRYVTSTYEQM